MKHEELMTNIKKHNVSENLFSINDGLKPNAYILTKNYSVWEYFFLDERGGRSGFKTFYNDESAFDFFWEKLLFEIQNPPSIPPSTVGI